MKTTKTKILTAILAIAILITSITVPTKASAVALPKDNGITIEEYITMIVKAMKLEVDKTSKTPYIDAAYKSAILRKSDKITYLNEKLTRTDAAVFANRADEELNGNIVSAKLLDTMLEKRISDINKIPKAKREDVAKIMAKGIIKGYFNGYYVQNREFRGNTLISKKGAKNVINLVLNPKKRASMSPDGQLIRTTNLPKEVKNIIKVNTTKEFPYKISKFPSYKDYPYILASFPNEFYQQAFAFHRIPAREKLVELKDYTRPVMMSKQNYKDEYFNSQEAYRLYKDEWIKKIERNLKTRLNVNYKTIDKDNKWFKDLRSTYYVMGFEGSTHDERTEKAITDYIKFVKDNKIVIKADKIAVEPSTMYLADGEYVRVYVKFKVSAKDMSKQDDLIYGQVNLIRELKKDKWYEGIFDVALGTKNGNSDGRDYAVSSARITDVRLIGK